MAPVLIVSLPKSSTCRNLPRDVVYAPKSEGGLGINNLYTHQDCSHIALFVEHIATNSITGQLLRTSLEYAQLKIGIGRNLFSLDYEMYHPLLTSSWIKSLWQFCHEQSINLTNTYTPNIPLQQDNNVFLMEIFANHGFTKGQLERINRCRIYLQVYALSDILNGHDTGYSKLAYSCYKDREIPHHYSWPHQPRPGPKSIAIWRKALRECFPQTQGIVQHPLGEWLYPPQETDWQWFYIPTSQTIYQRHGQQWRIWRRHNVRGPIGANPTFCYFSHGISLPRTSVQATIRRTDNN